MKCRAAGCAEDVPASVEFCRRHWLKIPKGLAEDINRHYRERGPKYAAAITAAVAALARKEGRMV